MTNEMVIREKAFSLRDFLSNEDRLKSFEAVLPKWLGVDRFLKVIFSSALRNPKILDCTKESILNAVMGCATLGLEPILGRAYLIPYNNNKQINGKWGKVLECQFQPGYQGLIDLARRTNAISDVQPRNVYENDDFDIFYEREVPFLHRPWFLTEKRSKGPGETLGAYANWILKDGSKHFEFMFIDDIRKRRDKSQAYQNDIKYKTSNSPWFQWPEEMELKTVIKHSSKMIPASIEFMQAVSYDDNVDLGGGSLNTFLAGGLGAGPGLTEGDMEEPPDNKEVFDTMLAEKSVDKERAHEFIGEIAKTYNKTTDEVITSAIDDIDKCLIEFRKWEGMKYKKQAEEPLDKKEKTLAAEIGKLKTTGLTEWEKANHDKIEGLSEEDKAFFGDKWHRVIGKGYYAEGQPGYKAPPEEKEVVEGKVVEEAEKGEEEVIDAEFTGTAEGTSGSPENDRSAKLKVEFRKAMLNYKEDGDEGLGSAKFYQVLRVANYKEIEDVPESQYNNILQAMEDARFSD